MKGLFSPSIALQCFGMNNATPNEIADCLESLASQQMWNPDVWQQCHDLVEANFDNELLAYVYDDIIHYSGLFHSINLLGFRVKPNPASLEDYTSEFRQVAEAIRAGTSRQDFKRLNQINIYENGRTRRAIKRFLSRILSRENRK
jgi:hypothetical protein